VNPTEYTYDTAGTRGVRTPEGVDWTSMLDPETKRRIELEQANAANVMGN
jgi:hypothetical protein